MSYYNDFLISTKAKDLLIASEGLELLAAHEQNADKKRSHVTQAARVREYAQEKAKQYADRENNRLSYLYGTRKVCYEPHLQKAHEEAKLFWRDPKLETVPRVVKHYLPSHEKQLFAK